MKKTLVRWLHFSGEVQRPVVILLLSSLLLWSFSQFKKIGTQLEILDFKNSPYQSIKDLNKLDKSFSLTNNIDFIVSKESPLSGEDICFLQQFSNDLSEEFNTFSLFSLRTPKLRDGKLWYKKRLYPCTKELSQLFPKNSWKKLLWTEKDIIFKASFSDTQIKDGTLDTIKKRFESLREAGFSFYMGSQSALKYYFYKSVNKDSFVNVLMVLLLFIFFMICYRNLFAFLYTLFSLFISISLTLGVMGFLGFDITLVNNGLFLMLAIATVQDIVFIFNDYATQKGTFAQSLENQILPCFFTTLTTVVGFLSLSFSPLAVINQFGLEAAAGALIEWFVVFFVCPHLFQVDKWKIDVSHLMLKIPHLPKTLGIFLLALLPLCFFFMNNITIEEKPINNFSSSHPYTKATLYLKESRNWESSIHLLWENQIKIEPTLSKIRTIEGVTDLFTIEQILKGVITQEYPGPIKDLIKRDASTLPFLSQFSDSKQEAALLYLNSYDLSFLKKTLKKIKDVCNEKCVVVGEPVVYEEFTTETVSYLKRALIFCFLLIGIVLSLISYSKTKSLLIVPKVIVSSFWGPMTLLGLIGIFNLPLQMTNIMILTVLIGLTGDNQIHYLIGEKAPEDLLKEKGIGSILMLLFMFAGGLLFLFMDFNPMKTLGLIFALGVTLSFIGDYFLFGFFLRK